MAESIKMVNAALDEDGSQIVLRGVIDPYSLQHLRIDDYQREVLPDSKIRELMKAIREGGVPDIELGMRGGNFREQKGNLYLSDPVYIIDGLQRTTAAIEVVRSGVLARLGAAVYFNTTKEWERTRFRHLNSKRTKLSPNVLLRNEKEVNPAVDMLINLCKDSTFSLCKRVCWEQRMKREQLIQGIMLAKSMAFLHRRFVVGLADNNFDHLSQGLNKLMERIGRNAVRENVKQFWAVIDECFGVHSITYAERAPQLRAGFLKCLCSIFASYTDFWEDTRFVIGHELKRKLKRFPLQDPHVASLCTTTGKTMKILYDMIVTHINSGKRTRRLTPFKASEAVMEIEEEPELQLELGIEAESHGNV